MINKILKQLKRTVLIDRETDDYIFFKPMKIEINGSRPYEKDGIFWRKKLKTQYGYKIQPMKSDNISWMSECEVYKINL